MSEQHKRGPLSGYRVLEFSGIGPGPHAAMLLSDLGAEVLRVDRPGGNGWPNPVLDRGRHALEINVRDEEGRACVLELAEHADVVIEGYRPGVMERLGLGPDILMRLNPRLVYGRMTGWGQSGPLADSAGHDINYIALTGALAAITDRDGQPVPPLSLVGDFGGGSLYLAFGIVAALLESERSGMGQIVDAAIVDGVASLMGIFNGFDHTGQLPIKRDRNVLSGAAHFYRCYECSDGKYVSVGPIEPKFYAELIDRIAAPAELRANQNDCHDWPRFSAALEILFKQKTQSEWCSILEMTNACFAPVLTLDEAPHHPHMRERNVYCEIDGVIHPSPAPRFSRTPGQLKPSGDGESLRAKWIADGRTHAMRSNASLGAKGQ